MRAITRVVLLAALSSFAACSSHLVELEGIDVRANLEDQALDGSMYTPETQSFLRNQHWLDRVRCLDLRADERGDAEIDLICADDPDYASFVNVPLFYLVPCLYYPASTPPDAFDAYNLMLAEYARNAVSCPFGQPQDEMTHFETSLEGDAAWGMPARPYEFVANPRFRPLRMSVVNNCLRPGLFELSANDNAGEIYHGWFSFPDADYLRVVARANALPEAFVEAALKYRSEDIELDLARLRTPVQTVGRVALGLAADGRSGYSSQGSRKKLAKGYVLLDQDGKRVIPDRLSQLTQNPLHMSSFVEPGKYSASERRTFDLSFLREVRDAEVSVVEPKTSYRWLEDDAPPAPTFRGGRYLELRLNLADYTLVIGNLPAAMLVPQEDFTLNGFGVGVMSASEPAERRRLLMSEGPSPSFAYLCRSDGDRLIGVNSHEKGLEQVFLRTRWQGGKAVWEVTLTSYERIVDLVKYEVPVPDALVDEMNDLRRRYISPVYLTYQDDNIR